MQPTAHDEYLVNAVMTASPQKLQLMLVEGAIRFAERGRQHLASADHEQACEALIRAQDIVGQILAGLNRETGAALVGKVAAVYGFVFRNLMEATFYHDEQRIVEALGVLEIERDTWRQLCEKMATSGESTEGTIDTTTFQEPPTPTGFPNLALDGIPSEQYSGGFSLDA
jgi:flagellar protein FliS